jgi:hypothetical protein
MQTRTLINAYLLAPSLHAVSQSVEWGYCFDVHCNSFVPWFMLTYVVQLLLLSVVLRDGIVAVLVSNVLYLCASGAYWYITFLGYSGILLCVLCIAYRLKQQKPSHLCSRVYYSYGQSTPQVY